jgi:cell division protein FtsI (penicillin-binding protein 3)
MIVKRAVLVSLCLRAAACSAAPSAPPAAPSAPAAQRLQRITGEEIDRAVADWGAARAVVVVLDPRTGAVLAMDGRDGGRPDRSLASAHAWVTGSTLKPITVAAALDARTITLDQRFPCGERAYGGEILHDAAEGPCAPLDAAGIIAQSSNVGVSYVFDTLGSARETAWLRKLHIGDPPGELPKIEDDKSLRAAYFAGGEVAKATPLQVAAAYAAIFNDGVYVSPSIGGRAPEGSRVLGEETARAIVAMLENAVAGDGTGKGARIAGARVAGKTGTADITGEAGDKRFYASFVGTVLDRESRFVALLGLEVPQGKATGKSAAAPAWGRLAARILAER